MLAASSTPLAIALLNPRSSMVNKPPIVVPPGVHTLLFNAAGCSPVSKTIRAVPSITLAAATDATSYGIPILTAPSIMDSIINKQKAGPDPINEVAMSMFFSGIFTVIPTVSINFITNSWLSSLTSGANAIAAVPQPNSAGVLVMTLATYGVKIDNSFIVVPANNEINNCFPVNDSLTSS
ncbi:conserved hypothetical protein [Candida albicans WO-1]|uniref:Uncharacterized protein n=1 Tax=Candida albicans (strain WO-1) TaxID=294748 RepID=C4YI51_CANAW|nr:conserved hypothetical protein [Candida albicans WO-1]